MTTAGRGSPEPDWPPEPDLGFSFRLANDTGRLTIEDGQFFDWLDIDRLELEVPGLEPPVDLAAGPERFQSRRTRVANAALSIGQRQLDRLVATLAPRLVAVGADRVALRPAADHLSVSARFRDGHHLADLVATVRILPRGGPLALVIDRALVFGFLPTPPPVLAHRLLTAMTGATETPHYPGAPVVRGLGLVEVDTLSALLWHLFPPRGWRLPDPRNVELIAVRPDRGKLVALFARGGEGASPDSAGNKLLASLTRHRSAEHALLHGDFDSALKEYRTALASASSDQDFVYRRLLGLAASRREHFAFALDLARDAHSRWPDFAEAHAAVGSVRIEQGDQWAAAERYRTLAETAKRIDQDAAVRAALLGARLLGRDSPDQATALYELVAELRPGQSEATDALIKQYRDHGRIHELVRLLRSRIAQNPNPRAKLADELILAEIYLDELDDPQSALESAERAAQSPVDHGGAELMIARAHLVADRRQPAIAALDRAAAKLADAGDDRGHVDALLQAGELLAEDGDAGQALVAYRRALVARPNDSRALVGAARAKMEQDEYAGAAALWQKLVDTSNDLPVKVASYALDLGRCLLTIGETSSALEHLAWAGERGDRLTRARAHMLLADQAHRDADNEVAIAELGHAIVALADDSSASARELGDDSIRRATAQAHHQRAELLAELGRGSAAASDYQIAFDLDIEAGDRVRAAEALLDLARSGDDEIAARRWLDALLELDRPPELRRPWLLERAKRALESGDPDRDRIGADIDAALEAASNPDQRAAALELMAQLKGDGEDPVGRAETLT
ncbi:MAG: hypothetical protein KJO07_20925, partial [Deltaproteobacteria bacterium]|nr:hypothetical protein [Deltaproteobacteria bacterium]